MSAIQKSSNTSNKDFLNALNKYIPSLVLQQLVSKAGEDPSKKRLPEIQKMETACLFADISGFTALGEACAKSGVRGNEELAFCINRYMEGMVKILGKYGGDIIKFVGDALIVMWPEDKSPQGSQTIVRKAIQCALDIQKEMDNFTIITGVSALSVKLGIGFGACGLLYVGGVFNRAEFFTVGSALLYALKSEGEAKKGGQIIVSETAFKFVREQYEAKEIISEANEKFYLILQLKGEGIKARGDALVMKSKITNETLNRIAKQLRGCVPAAIIPYLQIGAEQYGSETRSLTVMFASLGIELSSAEKPEGMHKIQKVVECIQEQVYRHGGSVNKLVMDDKGSTLVCLWGLSPMAHHDDAARAILTAFNMRKYLNQKFQTTVNVGISSGEMFSGVVGTSGGRKEFSVLGDVCNLAARIMYWPIKRKLSNKIHVDHNTRILATNSFSFLYESHYEFKGKSISIPIFEPINPADELADITKKMLMPAAYLKPHMNPLYLERGTEQSKSKSKMFGSAMDTVNDLATEIIEYFQSLQQKPYLASIKGEIGTGKTLFARCLVDNLCSNEDFTQMMSKPNNLFCSSLNSETQYDYLNIWRPILTQLLTFVCKRDGLKREMALYNLIVQAEGGIRENEKFTQILCEIFNANIGEKAQIDRKVFMMTNGNDNTQAQPLPRMFPFVQRVNYAQSDQIIKLVLHFLKQVIGETQPVMMQGQMMQRPPMDQTPILIILDSAQLMDSPSWRLFEAIRDNCGRIGIILLQQCNHMGDLIIQPESQFVFDQVWHTKSMDILHQIELPCLDASSLHQLLRTLALKYQSSYADEVIKMTDIVPDPYLPEEKTIKNKEKGDQWVRDLTQKQQLHTMFNDVHPSILKAIIRRCAGNPLLCMDFFVQLLQNWFISISASGRVVTEEIFEKCIHLNDYLTCPAPRIAIKQNLALIDNYVNKMTMKEAKRPGELEECMKSVVLMKAATVIGDDFDSKSIMASNPLRSNETPESIAKMLKLLEAENFIEILDESEKTNFKCRFNKPFLRETLYQVTLFRDQKQTVHGSVAKYLLHNQVQVVGRNRFSDPKVQNDILRNHLLIAQDCQEEKLLSFQARTGLFVRRIQNQLDKNPKGFILNEYIFKQGQAANKKTSKRLVTIDATYLRWYHNEKELNAGTYLGSVPIQFIYQTVRSKMAWLDRPSFSISTTQWFDKYQADQGKRDFFFACPDVETLEKWIITIEFMRTKAVYDIYTKRNTPVAFPLMQAKSLHSKDERKDSSGLLYDFSSQLKSNTSMRVGMNMTMTQTNLNETKTTQQFKTRQSVTVAQQPQTAAELVSKVKALYGFSMVSFSHHLQQTSAKITVSQQSAEMGKLPEHLSLKLSDKIDIALNDTSQYSSQKSLNLDANSETHKSGMRRRQDGRRGSSISADHVAAATELAKKRHNLGNDQIHEEEEGQTSDASHQKGRPLHKSQFKADAQRRCSEFISPDFANKLQQHTNNVSVDFERISKNTDSSPILSLTQDAPSQIPHNQTVITAQALMIENDEINRQTFAPQHEVVALFNPDERLDHLRSQSPPIGRMMQVDKSIPHPQQIAQPQITLSMSEQKAQIQPLQKTVSQIQLQAKLSEHKEPSRPYFPTMSAAQSQTFFSSQEIQEMISKQVQDGISKMIEENKTISQNQQKELSQYVKDQMQTTFEHHQYMGNGLNVSMRSNGGGVTSTRQGNRAFVNESPLSKQHRTDDEHPASPSPSPPPMTNDRYQRSQQTPQQPHSAKLEVSHSLSQILKAQNQQKEIPYDQQSARTVKREELITVQQSAQKPVDNLRIDKQYARYEEPTRNQKISVSNSQQYPNIVFATCQQTTVCQNNKNFKIPQGAQVQITQVLENFKQYRIMYNGQEGVFLKKDFSLEYQSPQKASMSARQTINQISPIRKGDQQNFFAELSQMASSQALQQQRVSQKILEEDSMDQKQKNLKMLERMKKKQRRKAANMNQPQ